MTLYEYINYSLRFYSIVHDNDTSDAMVEDALQFSAVIGHKEIAIFISQHLVKFYLPEDAFEHRIELRKLHDSMLVEETDPIVYLCNVAKYDSELKDLHGEKYSNVHVTLEKNYRSSLDLNGGGIFSLAKHIDFFTKHISSSLLAIEEEWRNQVS